jgi:hypothetical protein
VCGEEYAAECGLKLPKSGENLSGGEETPSTCDEVNTYYDENEQCDNGNNAFDRFVE